MEIGKLIVSKLLAGVENEVISAKLGLIEEAQYNEELVTRLREHADEEMINLFGTLDVNPIAVYSELVACGLLEIDPNLSRDAWQSVRYTMKFIPLKDVDKLAKKYEMIDVLAKACQTEYDLIFRYNKNGCKELIDLGFHEGDNGLIYPSVIVREMNYLHSWWFLLHISDKTHAFLVERVKNVGGPAGAYDIWLENFSKQEEQK